MLAFRVIHIITMEDIRRELVELFGESAPAMPRSKAEMEALPRSQQIMIAEKMPAFYQACAGTPETLPSAVALRRDGGQLRMDDADALRRAGLFADVAQLEAEQYEMALNDLKARVEHSGRYAPDPAVDEQRAREARVRSLSKSGFVGRVD